MFVSFDPDQLVFVDPDKPVSSVSGKLVFADPDKPVFSVSGKLVFANPDKPVSLVSGKLDFIVSCIFEFPAFLIY